MKYLITVTTENNPQALYRIVGIFVRRKIKINSLRLIQTKKKKISTIYINISIEESLMYTISKQINRIIEVMSVEVKEK